MDPAVDERHVQEEYGYKKTGSLKSPHEQLGIFHRRLSDPANRPLGGKFTFGPNECQEGVVIKR